MTFELNTKFSYSLKRCPEGCREPSWNYHQKELNLDDWKLCCDHDFLLILERSVLLELSRNGRLKNSSLRGRDRIMEETEDKITVGAEIQCILCT